MAGTGTAEDGHARCCKALQPVQAALVTHVQDPFIPPAVCFLEAQGTHFSLNSASLPSHPLKSSF